MTADPSWNSTLHDLLVDLVRQALAPDAPEQNAWKVRTIAAQTQLQHAGLNFALSPARLDSLWTRAAQDAEKDPAVLRGETVNPTLPMTCPISVADLFAAAFDDVRVVQQIRDTASFG